jgi:predicted metalloprotease
MPRARLARFAIAAILLALTATGCSTVVSGAGQLVAPTTAPDATLAVVGDGHTSFDRLARNSIADIVAFWKKQFPHIAGGKSLPPLTGKIYSVDDSDITASALRNGCLARAGVRVIKDNAFYCTLDDSIAYDRNGFLPKLVAAYGDYFAAAVFSHEFGHAVQARLGIADKERSIVRESQADCAAGAFTASVLAYQAPHLRVTSDQLDQILTGYIQLRDPVSHAATDPGTHGTGFDRLSSFSDGIEKGVKFCFASAYAKRQFTQRPFVSDSDAQTGGNVPLEQVLDPTPSHDGLLPNLNAFWRAKAKSIGKSWSDVAVVEADHPKCGATAQSDFGYCPDDNTVYYSHKIATSAYSFGDYALGTMFTYGWGLAVRHQLFQRSLDDKPALLAASCYSGAYAKSVNVNNANGFALSPPDMDEAATAAMTLVGHQEAFGDRGTTGLDRIDSFTMGYFGDLPAC